MEPVSASEGAPSNKELFLDSLHEIRGFYGDVTIKSGCVKEDGLDRVLVRVSGNNPYDITNAVWAVRTYARTLDCLDLLTGNVEEDLIKNTPNNGAPEYRHEEIYSFH